MATGFMDKKITVWRHCNHALTAALLMLGLCAAPSAWATKVTLVGLFPGKAVIVVNDGPLRTVAVGQKQAENVTLISTETNSAVFDIEGKRTTLEIGDHFAPPTGGAGGKPQSVTLTADGRGQFFATGQVNGRTVRFLVDTGASSVSLPAALAQSAGVDFRKGKPTVMQTANGRALAYRVLLDSVSLGEITLYQVEAVVHEGEGLDISLLGSSFLNRMEMKRNGDTMVLTRRF